ncbi:MAG: aminotransferase class I/II-fold pyridoxal phosphate-dependent enzyme [Reyranella sp.]|uniref:trans-sulfuration enzyme family protein n=1 Tax=Reyranella sp. TaxID=1929291 RepID=UPI0011FCF553|nr:aminotransferase class I/II-fold pyridoxal phosphate-dependent enzyme [Reyranella sp.]TAJ87868.1 MAG: aminotransferase class I/II-fold pyridoxal phosphate-dependent enzyme [Reyranella sp.]TBR29600.1 MAG: aminotransferase class I/II-fold pyridoxal phosphate-dependent enzyme [Reyranella sp.]
MSEKKFAPASLAAQAMGWIDPITKAVVPPIHMASTYLRDEDNGYRSGRIYARADNPTFDQAEATLTALEGGAKSLIFSSGMSAATACFLALAPGDHVVTSKVMYWALRNWLMTFATQWGLKVEFVDTDRTDEVAAAVKPGVTKLVWIETPANPTWSVSDIAAIADIAHKAGALLGVDSTVATPVLTRPIEHGADIVMHSATKYLNGHSDIIAGALTGARDDAYWAKLRSIRSQLGTILGQTEAWLLMRGMRTLFPRVAWACRSAQSLAEKFAEHPMVEEVLYPGLPSFAGHAAAAKQMKGGFGGMLSVRVKGGERAAIATAARVGLWKRATSLGGVESLIEHRASIEGPGTPCPPDLLRLSVGVEVSSDLFDDLDQALKRAHNA